MPPPNQNEYVFLNDNETFSPLEGATLVVVTDGMGTRAGCYDLQTLLQNISLSGWHNAMRDVPCSILDALDES